MDVNGTRFHLIINSQDWLSPLPDSSPLSPPVVSVQGVDRDKVEYVLAEQYLALKRLPPLFQRGRGSRSLEPEARRGSAVDRFGNWYWIANDRRRIYWQPSGMKKPLLYWDQLSSTCPQPVGSQTGEGFQSCDPASREVAELAGLAVTRHHYLVAGNVTAGGVLLFDLQAGGPPLLLLPFTRAAFPADLPDPRFEPFDMAAAIDGGVWILDRRNGCYWGLDRRFRPIIDPALAQPGSTPDPPDFGPVDGTETPSFDPPVPIPFQLSAREPVAIEALADGSVLVLDSPHATASDLDPATGSVVLRYLLSQPVGAPMALGGLEQMTAEGTQASELRLVLGHDFVFLPTPAGSGSQPQSSVLSGVLFVVDRDGNQTIAFTLSQPDGQPPMWTPLFDYLPLHYFGARALVGRGNRIYYDVVGGDPARDSRVRWMELQVIDQPLYEHEATLLLIPPVPVDPANVDDPSAFVFGQDVPLAQAFDGGEPGCVWHRVLIDGCIPPLCSVEVWARAQDQPDLLESTSFVQQPALYLRGSAGDGDTGCEIPYYRPFGSGPLTAPKGTWELLLQDLNGRYLQVQLVLRGNGRVSPELQALRIYYPRFSYLRRYLPRVYQDDDSSASFLDRMLANMEGFLTETDGKIERVPMLFDARTAVPEALDWLATWLGLVLDPLWAMLQQRRLADPGLIGQLVGPISSACFAAPSGVGGVGPLAVPRGDSPIVADRRRLVIRFARVLYQRRGTPDGIRFALHLLLDPCLETTLFRLKQAAIQPDEALRTELLELNLPYPTPTSSDMDLEDLLYALVLTPGRPATIRIVERFLTRGGKGTLAGDPTVADSPAPATPPTDPTAAYAAVVAATAHRFSVLVPAGLSDDEESMIRRVVNLEKPAHTLFDVRRYWDLFRVGEARLGIDSTLGDESRFVPMILGRDYLAEGFLSPAPPGDARDRFVSDRDRLGCLPGL
jgi:hypothetical protein